MNAKMADAEDAQVEAAPKIYAEVGVTSRAEKIYIYGGDDRDGFLDDKLFLVQFGANAIAETARQAAQILDLRLRVALGCDRANGWVWNSDKGCRFAAATGGG